MRRAIPIAALVGLVFCVAPACGDSDASAVEDTSAQPDTMSPGDIVTPPADTRVDAAADVTMDATAADAEPDATDAQTPSDADVSDGNSADAGDGADAADVAPVSCDRDGFVANGPTIATVNLNTMGEPVQLELFAQTAASAPFDRLSLTLAYPFGANDGPHVYAFDGNVFDTCHTCLISAADCGETGGCGKTYLPVSGTLVVTANGGLDAPFTGTLTSVVMGELGFDDQGDPALLPDGERWCIDSFTFDEILGLGD